MMIVEIDRMEMF